MVIALTETDDGTKEKTQRELSQIKKKLPHESRQKFDEIMEKVLMTALQLVPIDTGALASSIRIVEGALGGASGNIKEVLIFDKTIIAGDEMLINPKTGKPVNYAMYVHDGYSLPDGGWKDGTYFLTMAISQHYQELEEAINRVTEYLNNKGSE